MITNQKLHKILSITEMAEEQANIEIFSHHLTNFNNTQISSIVKNLLLTASEHIEQSIMETPESQLIGINNGSLYDEILVECGIYIDDDNTVYTNISFGKLADENTPLRKALIHVNQMLNFLAEKYTDDVKNKVN